MKLSIVIVSYNEIDFLCEAINSCININNKFDYEIIIGDDGSNDGSLELIMDYCKRYPNLIKYFVMERPNSVDLNNIIPSIRVSNVLKKAFQVCRGDYLTVMSADDVNTIPDRYTYQVDFLDSNYNYCSCYTDYKFFWNDKKTEEYNVESSINNIFFWGGFRYVHISCFVFRKECLKNLLDRFCDDTGLLYSILLSGKSKHLGINGFGYRQRDKSIMHEADLIELNLMEICLFQDCLNKGKMKVSSIVRFYRPLVFLKRNKEKLLLVKYKKYIDECKKCHNDILQLIIHGNVCNLLIKGWIYSKFYRILWRIVISRKFNFCLKKIGAKKS